MLLRRFWNKLRRQKMSTPELVEQEAVEVDSESMLLGRYIAAQIYAPRALQELYRECEEFDDGEVQGVAFGMTDRGSTCYIRGKKLSMMQKIWRLP